MYSALWKPDSALKVAKPIRDRWKKNISVHCRKLNFFCFSSILLSGNQSTEPDIDRNSLTINSVRIIIIIIKNIYIKIFFKKSVRHTLESARGAVIRGIGFAFDVIFI